MANSYKNWWIQPQTFRDGWELRYLSSYWKGGCVDGSLKMLTMFPGMFWMIRPFAYPINFFSHPNMRSLNPKLQLSSRSHLPALCVNDLSDAVAFLEFPLSPFPPIQILLIFRFMTIVQDSSLLRKLSLGIQPLLCTSKRHSNRSITQSNKDLLNLLYFNLYWSLKEYKKRKRSVRT